MAVKRKVKKRGTYRRRVKETLESVRHMPEVNYKPPVGAVEVVPKPEPTLAKKEESFWKWLLSR